MMKINVCPNCGKQGIQKVRRNLTGRIQGKAYSVPALEYYQCPHCDERVYDRFAMRKIESHSPAFRKRPADKKTA